jgi:hypothetical protein
MDLLLHAEAQEEWSQLPTDEYQAMANALAKLSMLGEQLGFPHTSNVRGERSIYASFALGEAVAAGAGSTGALAIG